MVKYGYARNVSCAFTEAIAGVKNALQEQRFGIVTEIDVRTKMLEKTGVDVGPYVILGACSPSDALRALQQDRSIGLLLPCNVIVHEQDDLVTIAAVMPETAMLFLEDPSLQEVMRGVQSRLIQAIDAVE